MRFRAIAVALVFPLGLLAACGDEDGGLTARTSDDEQSDTTEAEETDTTAEEESDTTEETSEDTSEDTTEDTESDDTVDVGDEDAVREAAIAAFVQQGLSEEDATCLVDEIGVDQLIDIGLDSGGDISEVDPEAFDVIADAVVACDINLTDLGG
jgi:hypothetical protein